MKSIYLPKQIEIGENSLENLGSWASARCLGKLFIIIDSFLTKSPINLDDKIRKITEEKDIEVTFFSDYSGEPTTDHVNSALEKLENHQSDAVVAIGGGSAIDLGKAVSYFALNSQMNWGEISSESKLIKIPFIAVPTTAGTGSEATRVMVITDVKTELKMNPGHQDLIPDIAILDPALTTSLPKHFTAYTGMDALTHAIEAYLSTRANTVTDHFALMAIEMVGRALDRVYEHGEDVIAREEMLVASCYAGMAFSNASTNLAHAIGRLLGTRFSVPHGLSVALVLPFVLRFTEPVTRERLVTVGERLGVQLKGNLENDAEETIEQIEKMNEQFGIWQDGATYVCVDELKENMSLLVEDALSGNGIETNRIIPTEEDIKHVLSGLGTKLTKQQNKKVTT